MIAVLADFTPVSVAQALPLSCSWRPESSPWPGPPRRSSETLTTRRDGGSPPNLCCVPRWPECGWGALSGVGEEPGRSEIALQIAHMSISFAFHGMVGQHALVDNVVAVGEAIPVRAATSSDVVVIRALALDNGMFEPEDMDTFDESLSGYLDGSLDGHAWVVATDGRGRSLGAAYYAPEPFGDRVWNLYFLAVGPGEHRQGVGSSLVRYVEQTLRAKGEPAARVLVVETSSGAAYEGARGFYAHQGFDREAVIREFYGPGEDKVVFWKSLI
jgi:ribosomal protein S18 acetylase RimI-like enzyme